VVYILSIYYLIGDNGQGDVRTAELVLTDSAYSKYMQRVYVHTVQALEKTYVQSSLYKSTRNKHICYFLTYIDAAIDAYEQKLIRISGLRRVMEAAKADFLYISTDQWAKKGASSSTNSKHTAGGSAETENRLTMTTSTSSEAVNEGENDNSMPSSSGNSSTVSSSSTRSSASAKTVSLRSPAPARPHWKWRLSTIFSTSPPNTNSPASNKSRVEDGLTKRFVRLMELNHAISRGNNILASQKLESVSALPYPQHLHPGDRVKTDFGSGLVKGFRKEDGIYTIEVSMGEAGKITMHIFGAAVYLS
jgi:hypothetical protein